MLGFLGSSRNLRRFGSGVGPALAIALALMVAGCATSVPVYRVMAQTLDENQNVDLMVTVTREGRGWTAETVFGNSGEVTTERLSRTQAARIEGMLSRPDFYEMPEVGPYCTGQEPARLVLEITTKTENHRRTQCDMSIYMEVVMEVLFK